MSQSSPKPRSPSGHAILGGKVLDGGRLRSGRAVLVRGETILDVVPAGAVPETFDQVCLPDDVILAPGFIDWQVNGGGGVLLNDRPDAEGMALIARAHRRFGTTGLLPTLITDRLSVMERLAEAVETPVPGVLGLHLEGPFINVARKGVHSAEHIRRMTAADIARLRHFARAGRSLVTLAPECVPESAITTLVEAGLVVSIGHSEASAAQVHRAAERGATGVTHLFNAMSQITPREPGVVGAAFTDSRLIAGAIVDGLHVAPDNLRIAARLLGTGRLSLVSDAMPLVGSPDRSFDLMGHKVTLDNGGLTTGDGTLAGAHLTMIEAVRRAVLLIGLSLEEALTMASVTPAALLGLGDRLGTIRAGALADLVAFDNTYHVIATWLRGEVEWTEPGHPPPAFPQAPSSCCYG